MAGENARLGDGPNLVRRLLDQIVDLGNLRRDGLRLVSAGDAGAVEAWHRQWAALFDEIRTQLDLEAPRQAELVLWPAVSRAQDLRQTREELVRAAVGCRELVLLVNQLNGAQEGNAVAPETLPPPAEAPRGSTFVRGGQRFEGAIRLRQLIEPAQESLFVIDPYVADGTFTLAAAAPDGITRRFLSSDHLGVRREVTEAWADQRANWGGSSECRIGSELPHFRLLFVDGAAYHVDASLKDFGSSWTFFRMLPTNELRQVEGEIESLWRQATPV